MTRLPSLTSKKIINVLEKAGFEVLRQKGSHAFLKHIDGRCTVVPIHHGEDIGRGLLRKILRDTEMSLDELLNLK